MSFGIGSRAVVLTTLLLGTLLPTTIAQDSTTNTSIASSEYSNSDVQIAINVPEGAEKTDLYFNFQAPSEYAWVGFGMGMVMDSSLMFIAYRSQDNQGAPTISTRVGENHFMPTHYNGTSINILDGSEVTSDKFIVRLHCKDCRNWGEGNLDTSSTAARFFYALGPIADLQSDDVNATIRQHSSHPKQFQLDMKAATGSTVGVPVFASSADDSDDDREDIDDFRPLRIVGFHAFVMSFAFAIVYPVGYLLLRLFDRLWLHWGTQAFGTVLVFAGAGSGIVASKRYDLSPSMTHPHQIIGIVAFAVVIAALILGGAGHMSYKKKGVPSPLMKAHRILGPAAILLGFVNACVGLAWTGRMRAIIGYSLFVILVWLVILGLILMRQRRRVRRNAMNSAAAQNFRSTNTAYTHVRNGSIPQNQFAAPPPAYSGYGEQNVPLQSFNRQPQHGNAEYYGVQPNKWRTGVPAELHHDPR